MKAGHRRLGTAYGTQAEAAHVQPGDTMLIGAGSSGVGLASIQTVNALGATPVVTTRTRAKRERLLEAGRHRSSPWTKGAWPSGYRP